MMFAKYLEYYTIIGPYLGEPYFRGHAVESVSLQIYCNRSLIYNFA